MMRMAHPTVLETLLHNNPELNIPVHEYNINVTSNHGDILKTPFRPTKTLMVPAKRPISTCSCLCVITSVTTAITSNDGSKPMTKCMSWRFGQIC